MKRTIEERLATTLDFYVKQVDQRNWYGFWDYVVRVEGPESLKPVDESGLAGTNGAAQNGLTTIISLGMVGDHLRAEFPPQDASPAGRERGAQRENQRTKTDSRRDAVVTIR